MNWGRAIVLSFIVFIVFIGVLVILSVREDVSLVSDNYYPEDRAYGRQMERLQSAADLAELPVIEIRENPAQMIITFPEGYADAVEGGQVKLFRPSNKELDQSFVIRSGRPEPLALTSLQRGRYKVMLTWSMGGKEYYIEKSFSV